MTLIRIFKNCSVREIFDARTRSTTLRYFCETDYQDLMMTRSLSVTLVKSGLHWNDKTETFCFRDKTPTFQKQN